MSKGHNPIRSSERDRTGEYYWLCPKCNHRVGGYIITGSGDDDWGYEEYKFCRECGTEINWIKETF